MGTLAALAGALRYPAPDRLGELQRGAAELAEAADVGRPFAAFLDEISRLTLAEWEELHTRTLDLSPPVVLYVGHAIWGESYKRGEFMASLKRAEDAESVDPDSELPDHLLPVLLYLDVAAEPLPELVEVIGPALQRMRRDLEKAEPENPYVGLLDAIRAAVGAAVDAPVRASR